MSIGACAHSFCKHLQTICDPLGGTPYKWKYLLFVESPNQATTILGESSDLTYMSSLWYFQRFQASIGISALTFVNIYKKMCDSLGGTPK